MEGDKEQEVHRGLEGVVDTVCIGNTLTAECGCVCVCGWVVCVITVQQFEQLIVINCDYFCSAPVINLIKNVTYEVLI